MAISFVAANAAYQAASGMGASSAAAAPATGATSFGDILSDAVKNAESTMRAGESAAAQGAAGQGDVVQMVSAVNAAELTLQTVVAIRDKVIGAYQDILKMPI